MITDLGTISRRDFEIGRQQPCGSVSGPGGRRRVDEGSTDESGHSRVRLTDQTSQLSQERQLRERTLRVSILTAVRNEAKDLNDMRG